MCLSGGGRCRPGLAEHNGGCAALHASRQREGDDSIRPWLRPSRPGAQAGEASTCRLEVRAEGSRRGFSKLGNDMKRTRPQFLPFYEKKEQLSEVIHPCVGLGS